MTASRSADTRGREHALSRPLYHGPWGPWEHHTPSLGVYRRTRQELQSLPDDATGCGYHTAYQYGDWSGDDVRPDGAVRRVNCDRRCYIMQADDYGPARVLPVCTDHLAAWVGLVGVGGVVRQPVRTARSLNRTISEALLVPRYTPALLLPSQVVSHGPRDEVLYLEVRYKLASERSCVVPLDVHVDAKVAADELEGVSILDGVHLLNSHRGPGLRERLRVLAARLDCDRTVWARCTVTIVAADSASSQIPHDLEARDRRILVHHNGVHWSPVPIPLGCQVPPGTPDYSRARELVRIASKITLEDGTVVKHREHGHGADRIW